MPIDRRQVEEEFRAEAQKGGVAPKTEGAKARAGGNGAWLKDDYDEKQRAHIWEIENTGPVDGLIQTDMPPDPGGDPDVNAIAADDSALDGVVDTNRPKRRRR